MYLNILLKSPEQTFWSNDVDALKGSISITLIIALLIVFVGNHIPLKIDWHIIIIDDIPPMDFSLHRLPNNIPKPINKVEIKSETTIPNKRLIEKNVESRKEATPKNKIDWINEIGIIEIE